jgi:uncharacterized protein
LFFGFFLFLLTPLLAYANNGVMARPKKCRCIGCSPNSSYFKPKGIPLFHLEEVRLNLDEIEAIRLADYEGLYHQDAAARMKISRQTLERILNEARRKVAEALIQGKALKLETKEIQKEDIT